MNTRIVQHTLDFKAPSGTSRGVLTTKPNWYIVSEEDDLVVGLGECSLILGLSPDDPEKVYQALYDAIQHNKAPAASYPAARFAFEMWKESLSASTAIDLYPSPWSKGEDGIPINGLIWMGPVDDMKQQIKEKILAGYSCIKMKIGAIDFEDEIGIIRELRATYAPEDITIRVDANGAFSSQEALEKLKRLAEFDIHSIEQPIRQGLWQDMARLCEESPLDIALDEELIGINDPEEQEALLATIKPAYIILKPSLVGGIAASQNWIEMAKRLGIGWWITSALESNIGLNAIARWTAHLEVTKPQGLGTGGLFTNNIPGSLYIKDGYICNDPEAIWEINKIL